MHTVTPIPCLSWVMCKMRPLDLAHASNKHLIAVGAPGIWLPTSRFISLNGLSSRIEYHIISLHSNYCNVAATNLALCTASARTGQGTVASEPLRSLALSLSWVFQPHCKVQSPPLGGCSCTCTGRNCLVGW
jgi:hypothetical protein